MKRTEGIEIDLVKVADVLDEFLEDALESKRDDLIAEAAGRLLRMFRERTEEIPTAMWDDAKITGFCEDFETTISRIRAE